MIKSTKNLFIGFFWISQGSTRLHRCFTSSALVRCSCSKPVVAEAGRSSFQVISKSFHGYARLLQSHYIPIFLSSMHLPQWKLSKRHKQAWNSIRKLCLSASSLPFVFTSVAWFCTLYCPFPSMPGKHFLFLLKTCRGHYRCVLWHLNVGTADAHLQTKCWSIASLHFPPGSSPWPCGVSLQHPPYTIVFFLWIFWHT